jgi:hypothetical protein
MGVVALMSLLEAMIDRIKMMRHANSFLKNGESSHLSSSVTVSSRWFGYEIQKVHRAAIRVGISGVA